MMHWKIGCGLLLAVWLSACGNKGPLVLPDTSVDSKVQASVSDKEVPAELESADVIDKPIDLF